MPWKCTPYSCKHSQSQFDHSFIYSDQKWQVMVKQLRALDLLSSGDFDHRSVGSSPSCGTWSSVSAFPSCNEGGIPFKLIINCSKPCMHRSVTSIQTKLINAHFPKHRSLTKIYPERQIFTAWWWLAKIWESRSLALATWNAYVWMERGNNVYRTFRSLRLPTFILSAWAEDQLTLGRSRSVSGEGLSKTVGWRLRVCFSKGFTCKGWPSSLSSSGCLFSGFCFVIHGSCLDRNEIRTIKYMKG